MKIRDGFVSNSSSSSFIIITTKENYDEVLKKSNDYTKSLVDQLKERGNIFEGKFLDKDVMVITGFSDMGGGNQLDEISISLKEGGEEIEVYDLYEVFENEITKNNKESITVSVDN